jgi:hypothetical protein
MDKKRTYSGYMPLSYKIIFGIVTLFFIGSYVPNFFLNSKLSFSSSTGLIFPLFILAIIVGIFSISMRKKVTITPDNRVVVGAAVYMSADPDTYAYVGNKGRVLQFNIKASSIKQVYAIRSPTEKKKIKSAKSFGKLFSTDPIGFKAFHANKIDKTICIEFKQPIPYKKKRVLEYRKMPDLDRIYVSVREPEKLVRDLQSIS